MKDEGIGGVVGIGGHGIEGQLQQTEAAVTPAGGLVHEGIRSNGKIRRLSVTANPEPMIGIECQIYHIVLCRTA